MVELGRSAPRIALLTGSSETRKATRRPLSSASHRSAAALIRQEEQNQSGADQLEQAFDRLSLASFSRSLANADLLSPKGERNLVVKIEDQRKEGEKQTIGDNGRNKKGQLAARASGRAKRISRPKILSRISRGPYRRYSLAEKRKAIMLAEQIEDTCRAAHILSIPVKNLRRWVATGPLRKRGGEIMRRTQDARPAHGERVAGVGGRLSHHPP